MNSPEERSEIIIIKRGGEHGDGHHGGAWKIAFADFMTAMMALFLVLWLVNAANEETKKSVASYFNPVKLVDRNRSTKGLDEMSGGPADSSESTEETEVEHPAAVAEKHAEAPTDAELNRAPYEVLEKIVAAGEGAQAVAGTDAAKGGVPYRDPFAPDYWNREAEGIGRTGEGGGEGTLPKPDESVKTSALDQTEKSAEEAAAEGAAGGMQEEDAAGPAGADGHEDETANAGDKPDDAASDKPEAAGAGEMTADAATPASETDPEQARKQALAEEADRIKNDIEEAMKLAFGGRNATEQGLTVKPVDDGVMISITDQFDWSMFEIGSAVPKRELILAMEKVSSVLADRNGSIRIYGHTDSRPFASGSYGNWQLSTARAQSAYFMLVRGGLAEDRVAQISGFADRDLKLPSDPNAAANRRIEILLEVN
ncbi:MAG: MotB family protein [Rhizobiaceae bacterium]